MPAVTEYADTADGPVELHQNRFLSVKYDGRHHFVRRGEIKDGFTLGAMTLALVHADVRHP